MEGRRGAPPGSSSFGSMWSWWSESSHRKLLSASEKICHVDILRQRVDFPARTRVSSGGQNNNPLNRHSVTNLAEKYQFCFLFCFKEAGSLKVTEGNESPMDHYSWAPAQ